MAIIQTLAEARNIVENNFISSPYINSRTFANSTTKYFPEEVEYWAKKMFNSNWSESLFVSEFNNAYANNNKTSLSSIKYNDYIGQTFYVDPGTYPRGLFLSSVLVYFYDKDSTAPVTLDVRPLINGYPSSDKIVPMSIVTLFPEDIFVPLFGPQYDTDATSNPKQVSLTDTVFNFDFPIYLAPGWYCFTLRTNSAKNSVYITERGVGDINTGVTVTNPYMGDFVVSQQGTSWSIDQTRDLCFTLKRAKFELGSKDLVLKSGNINFDYDLLNFTSHNLQFGDFSYIDNISTSVTDSSTAITTDINIETNKNISIPSVSTANTTDGVSFTVTMVNTDDALTPIVDLHRTGVALVKNYIDEYSAVVADSELTSDGYARAKYVTKQVILNDEFDADGLTVYLDVNKPSGTDVVVYYKILNKYDFSISFDNAPWVLMTKTSQSQVTISELEYSEETYQNLNITYTGVNGVSYDSFKYFAVKIVMYSSDSTKVPSIKNLRAIATV